MRARSKRWRFATVATLTVAVFSLRAPATSSNAKADPRHPVAASPPRQLTAAPPTTVRVLPFPGPRSVGHLADVPGFNVPARTLTPHPGNYVTTHDGEIIEAMDIGGSVFVQNKNVVIRRNRIALGVETAPGGSAWVAWNTIGPDRGTEKTYLAANGRGSNIVFYRNEIFGGVDLFNFNGADDVTILENWAYGPYQMLADPYQMDQRPTTSHSDGIQVQKGGSHFHVVGNRFDLFLFRGYRWSGKANASTQEPLSPAPHARDRLGITPNIAPLTTGFLFQQSTTRSTDIVFDGNRIDGDYYRVWSFERGSFAQSATNVRITNNTIVRRYSKFGRRQLIGADTYSNITWENNVDQSGDPIPPTRGMQSDEKAVDLW